MGLLERCARLDAATNCAQLGLPTVRAPREGGAMHRAAVLHARIAEARPGGLLVALLPPHTEDGFGGVVRTWTVLPDKPPPW
ncbi:hypothetical protein [Polyangium sp. 6x1]|uniref:hypothetical protein n=1 Tax=Polyangium sp. 6x1 TaxID=3042689 RepID=UPI00248211AD|nr:hypothetical protein [Polyangium sp. 6x1]MDI1442416.1 hypothetical protein [Polyangium sp. 6x1]